MHSGRHDGRKPIHGVGVEEVRQLVHGVNHKKHMSSASLGSPARNFKRACPCAHAATKRQARARAQAQTPSGGEDTRQMVSMCTPTTLPNVGMDTAVADPHAQKHTTTYAQPRTRKHLSDCLVVCFIQPRGQIELLFQFTAQAKQHLAYVCARGTCADHVHQHKASRVCHCIVLRKRGHKRRLPTPRLTDNDDRQAFRFILVHHVTESLNQSASAHKLPRPVFHEVLME